MSNCLLAVSVLVYSAQFATLNPPPLGMMRRHILAHHMDNIPTMVVRAHRSSHRDTVLDTTCLLCGTQQETAPHLSVCSTKSHEWRPARKHLAAWLDCYVGHRAAPVRT